MDQPPSLTNTLHRLLERKYAGGSRRLYFSSILRETNLPSETVEKVLLHYFQSGDVEGTLELQCPECGKDLGEYRRLRDLPEETECFVCGAKIPRSVDYVELVVHLKSNAFFRGRKRSHATSVRT